MGILKRGTKTKTKGKKATSVRRGKSSEAKAVLARMQAKKDAGDCPFC